MFLALGTNIVANIIDRLSSDLPCYHDRAYVSALPTFNPHGGPITHSSTGSKPDPPVPPFSKSILTLGFVCNSRATFLVIYSGNRCNIQSRCFGPLSHSFPASNDCLSAWNSLSYLLTLLTIHSYVLVRELLLPHSLSYLLGS